MTSSKHYALTRSAANRPIIESISTTAHCRREQVRIIGIGVGGATFELAHFRKRIQITYPLFPEAAFVIHKA